MLSLTALFCLALAIALVQPQPLPSPQAHPLPSTLANWKAPNNAGDYFDQVKPVNVGYLVWSNFPVTVYVEPLKPNDSGNPAQEQRAKAWIQGVLAGVQEWRSYLPLQVVDQAEGADISILRSQPPIRLERSSDSSGNGRSPLSVGRVRSAETRFELYRKPIAGMERSTSSSILAHRVTILLRPDQASQYIQAAARHELGHALGIWGHSPLETDALYFAQVRNPAPISARDINTLKRVYQQPTRLGWPLSQ